jgi:hypothetical protein
MSQIYLHIAEHPQDFPTDDEKIFYIQSHLRGMAQQWFQPNIFAGRQAPIPHWDGNWGIFVQELASNFGLHDPFGDAQISLDSLSMKPGDRLATYQLEFDTHALMTGYNEAPLFQVYYHGLPSRLKDTMAQNQLPASLARLNALALQLDQRYHRCNSEHAAECAAVNLPPAGESSGATSSAPASGGGGSSGKSKGKGKGGGKSDRPAKTNPPANTPANGNTVQASRSKSAAKPYAAKLNSSSKLKPEECKRCMKNNLCMFCGGAGHKMAECEKHLANAQGKAGNVAKTLAPTADASSSESKK